MTPANTGVSVCLFSYNYEKYIAQAIESVLAQETTFPVEIVVGDDCSTDGTRAIAEQYSRAYPGKIVLSFNETNMGGTRNWIATMNRCKGKYIALLDGDDYFTDNKKLQKQFDALERDPGYVLSFHSVEEKYDDISGMDKIVAFEQTEYTIQDFLRKGWFVRTGATFFRNGIVPAEPPLWVYDFPYRYDTILHIFLCMHGRALNIKEVMSVWRKHSKGMSYVLLDDRFRNVKKEIALAEQLNAYTEYKYASYVRSYIKESLGNVFLVLLRSGKIIEQRKLLFKCITGMSYKTTWGNISRKLRWN